METLDKEIIELRGYVQKKGFKHENVWYFRITWIDKNLLRIFEENGLVKKAGTLYDLKSKGVPLPDRAGYCGRGILRSLICQVDDNKINEEVL